MSSDSGPSATELFRAWFEHSPFTQQLELEIELLEPDEVVLRMPFSPSRTTYADIVHGGAIAALADVAATGAAWSSPEHLDSPRGATVSLTMQYLRAGKGDLRARGRLLRRGGLCSCEVDVLDGAGALVARGLSTYKLG